MDYSKIALFPGQHDMRTILIADDNATLRRSLKIALEAAGYSVELARNGAEALARQRESAPDVLITDLFMPECDGFELIEAFRKLSPRTKIVAISGDAQRVRREYLSTASLIGVDAALKKPFKIENLLETLRALEQR